ncbi:PKD domain-containing protein [Lacinutrix sp. Hel_I_90]|uniref:PKD domain-containing protein n=1 Tax=Lacinutrix sp. Hel_I_90 TaxID=1249999 RepID=UPI000695D58B|nr:PKD domain-containing protein [Lacinutrix sp. Hel_I_90]
MKTLKHLFCFFLITATYFACNQDDDNTDFINEVPAPTNVSALVTVTQDNTGLVTITPLGEGVTTFVVNYGDGSENNSEILRPGYNTQHTYAEGVYLIAITATGVNGKTTTVTQEIVVSFQAPQNLMVTIENDSNVSKQVNVTASAEFALSYEVDFGELGSTPIMGNIDDTVSYTYQEPGTYTITVTAFSAAVETTSYSEAFLVTEILAPLNPAPTPPARVDSDVVSVFSDAYTDVTLDELPTVWSSSGFEATTVESDNIWKLTTLDFLGIVTNYANGIDVSAMETLHIDYWVPSGTTNELFVKIVNTVDGGEDIESLGTTVGGSWQSIDIDMTVFDDGNLANKEKITQLIIDSDGVADVVYIDNFYFYKLASGPSPLIGTWKMAPEAGALGVGPAPGDISWFACDAACVTDRACYFDDTYVFGANGSFTNVLGTDTWIEPWQGGNDACGTPVAPYNGVTASFTHNETAGTVTLNGTGAYIGLPKANNQGELPNVPVPNAITYTVTFIDMDTISVYVESGAGVFWQYKLVREIPTTNSPLVGTWQMAPEAGSLGVGPAPGDTSWFACDAACVTDRACYFDDTYVFGANGSFTNVLGVDTWIEPWQGGNDACGTPVAPHDGNTTATFIHDETAGTVTINGVGAYLGLPKANNQGELPNVAVPNEITYTLTFIDTDTISVYVESGAGVFWQYKLIRN